MQRGEDREGQNALRVTLNRLDKIRKTFRLKYWGKHVPERGTYPGGCQRIS